MEPDGRTLPEGAEILARRMLCRQVPTTSQLLGGPELSEGQVKRWLRHLKEEGLVTSIEFGCVRPGVSHHLLTPELLDLLGASEEERSLHGQGPVGNRLLYDLPKMEAVNEISEMYAGEGWILSRIQPCERELVSAIVEYLEPTLRWPAYQVICAPSLGQSQRYLANRFELVQETVRTLAGLPEDRSLRASLCIVADDAWEAGRAMAMAVAMTGVTASGWLSPEDVSVWYHSGNTWYVSDGRSLVDGEAPTGLPPLNLEPALRKRRLPLTANDRKLGRQTLAGIMERSPWVGGSGMQLFELFTLVGKYPVGSVAHYQALAGEGRDGKENERRLKELAGRGLVKVVARRARAAARRLRPGVPVTVSQRGQGADRYALTKEGRRAFWYAHGILPQALYRRSGHSSFDVQMKKNEATDDPKNARCLFRHRDIVYEILAGFRERGMAVAPGWLAHVLLPNNRRIQPDGVVRFQALHAWTWAYLEVELSQRTPAAFQDRCQRYGSEHRPDPYPLLMVLHDDLAEKNFHQAVKEFAPELMVWTTTLRRLRDGGVVGAGTWLRVE